MAASEAGTSYNEFWLVGDYPTLDALIYSEGHKEYSETELNRKNWDRSKYTKLAFSGVSSYSATLAVPAIYFLYNSLRMTKRSKQYAWDVDNIRAKLIDQINLELNNSENGRQFLDHFGKVLSIKLDESGYLQAFSVKRNLSFYKKEKDGVYYFSGIWNDFEVLLFIEPNFM